MAELVDAPDLGSGAYGVGVRVPSPAPNCPDQGRNEIKNARRGRGFNKERTMTVKETLNDGLKRGYEITVTAAELDATVLGKLKEAQPEVEMKGFRKGKVPMAMMKKQFGPKVLGEAMQESVDGAMNAHLEATGDRPGSVCRRLNTSWRRWRAAACITH